MTRVKQFDADTRAKLESRVDETEARRRKQIEAFRMNGEHVRVVELAETSHYCFVHKPGQIADTIRAWARHLQ